jgi:hypothetical protein
VQKDGPEPEFLNPMENVTVALGREAILVCSVKNIGEHKVSLDKNKQFCYLLVTLIGTHIKYI